jgi:hypothetical protein
MVSGFASIVPVIGITPECFVRLCRVHKIVATINRKEDFLRGELRFRGIKITTYVWIKSRTAAHDWELLNQLSQPMLEVKRTGIGVKRTAIADKRRLIGLPAPKVVDVH